MLYLILNIYKYWIIQNTAIIKLSALQHKAISYLKRNKMNGVFNEHNGMYTFSGA